MKFANVSRSKGIGYGAGCVSPNVLLQSGPKELTRLYTWYLVTPSFSLGFVMTTGIVSQSHDQYQIMPQDLQ